jgi:transposase
MSIDDSLPTDLASAHALIIAQRQALIAAQSEAQHRALLIEKLKYTIKKLRHEQFGQSSERGALLDQLELQLADLEEDAAQAEAAVAAEMITVPSFERRKPARRPLPAHLARERIVYPAPSACPCCGDNRLRKIGEDVTETLELIPRQWKVIQHVREKFSCRACEAITRGRAGPKLLAHILFSKYGLHLPLNRQGTTYAREGIDLDVSTLADWVGAAAATLMPLNDVIRTHVFAAERIHADDTTVPVLAKDKTRTGRLWTYVRDDRPFGGPDPPAAVFFYSGDRSGEHPEQHLACYAGLMQADAYAATGCTRPTANRGQLSRPPVGRMDDASSSIWRGSTRRRSRPRRSSASMPSSPSSARSMARHRWSASALEADLLLWPRPAGRPAEGMVRQTRKRRRRPACLLPSRPHERPRQSRPMEGGPREEGGVEPLRRDALAALVTRHISSRMWRSPRRILIQPGAFASDCARSAVATGTKRRRDSSGISANPLDR